jgi:hypothetical protein
VPLPGRLRDLGYQEIDATLLQTPEAKEQLQKAKELLLGLHDDPSSMSVVESTLYHVKDRPDRVRRFFPRRREAEDAFFVNAACWTVLGPSPSTDTIRSLKDSKPPSA